MLVPCVSIVVPVYNISKYLKKCLNSIINQTLKEIEIILINDCSPDAQDDEICKEYATKDSRIIYLTNEENQGQHIARKRGMEVATGLYIGFVDPDDYIELNSLELLYGYATKKNADIVEFSADRVAIDESFISLCKWFRPLIQESSAPFADFISHIKSNYCFKFYKAEIVKNSLDEIPDVRLKFGEEFLGNFHFFLNAKKYVFLDEVLYHYRQNPRSSVLSQDNIIDNISSILKVRSYFREAFLSKLTKELYESTLNKLDSHIQEVISFQARLSFKDKLETSKFRKQENQQVHDLLFTNSNPIVLQLVYTASGGAGLAAKRLHQALENSLLCQSKLISKQNQQVSHKEAVYLFHSTIHKDLINQQNDRSNIHKGNTIFSLPEYFAEQNKSNFHVYAECANIIHLHWVARFISNETLAYLSHLNKPIVWTFHDKNPLTGGCHYFHGCEKWKSDCMDCPQLIDSYDNYPAKVLATKKKYINFKNITVVVLNEHFKELVEQSPLFGESRIEIIPNGLDTKKYAPIVDNTELRKKLKLPINKKILLYVAAYASTVKGYKEFCQTIELLKSRQDFHLLLVGSLPKERDFSIVHTDWGHVDETRVIEAYRVADITILSSVEDNLPNIMLESLSCGTPVVGFKVGGLPFYMSLKMENITCINTIYKSSSLH